MLHIIRPISQRRHNKKIPPKYGEEFFMRKSKFTDSQIMAILKQCENGIAVADPCREYDLRVVPPLIIEVKSRELCS
jgi:hypothetical protein